MDTMATLFSDPSYGARPNTDRFVLIFTDGDATLDYTETTSRIEFGTKAQLDTGIDNMLNEARSETNNAFDLYTLAWVDRSKLENETIAQLTSDTSRVLGQSCAFGNRTHPHACITRPMADVFGLLVYETTCTKLCSPCSSLLQWHAANSSFSDAQFVLFATPL
jgi:hypothetical protein